MATVGTVDIMARMNVNGVVAGANKATAVVSAMGKSITGTFKAMATSIVPTVSVEGFISGIKNIATAQSKFIDDTGKLADRLGIGTEALVGMGHAADLAGVSAEEFGSMLEKLQKNIGTSVGEDGGKIADGMAKLGIKMKDVEGLGVDQIFLKIADAVQELPDPTQRAAAMFEMFGKSGQKLTNTMLAGKAGIRESMDEAVKLGMTFSRIDASKVEAANDAFTRMKGAIAGVGNTITIGLAPYIEQANKAMTAFIASSGQTFGKTLVNGFIAAVDAVQIFYAALLRVGATLGDIVSQVGQMLERLGKNSWIKNPAMVAAGKNMDISGQTFAMNMNGKAGIADAAPRWSKSIADTANAAATQAVAAIQDKSGAWAAKIFGPGGWLQTGRMLGESLVKGVLEASKSAKEKWASIGKSITDSVQTPMEKWRAKQEEIDAAFKSGNITGSVATRATAANFNDLRSSTGSVAVVSPQAAAFGSSEAINRVAQFRNEGRGGSSKGIADVFVEARKQSALQAKIDSNTAAMVNEFRNIGAGTIP